MTNYKTKFNQSYPEKIFAPVIAKIYETRLKYLQNNYDDILAKSSKSVENRIHQDQNILKRLVVNKHTEILTRSEKEMKQLAQIKEVVMSLNPLIAGAIGENLVVNEIKKLSDDYILINNFTLQLDTPIYYKKDKSKIHSIQIDHLLISKAGIFILETKNWSRKTMESKHVRSPVEQGKTIRLCLVCIAKSKKYQFKKTSLGRKQGRSQFGTL